MTHADIENLTDGQVAEAVAKAMGWERVEVDYYDSTPSKKTPSLSKRVRGYYGTESQVKWEDLFSEQEVDSVGDYYVTLPKHKIIEASGFSPCTDANDDLIVLDWARCDCPNHDLVVLFLKWLRLSLGSRDVGTIQYYVPGTEAMTYLVGDYSRALLHAQIEVTDGEDI